MQSRLVVYIWSTHFASYATRMRMMNAPETVKLAFKLADKLELVPKC